MLGTSVLYIFNLVGINPDMEQLLHFSSEELHWVSHGVVDGKCQYFT